MNPGMKERTKRMSRFLSDQKRWNTTNKPMSENTERTTQEGGSVKVTARVGTNISLTLGGSADGYSNP